MDSTLGENAVQIVNVLLMQTYIIDFKLRWLFYWVQSFDIFLVEMIRCQIVNEKRKTSDSIPLCIYDPEKKTIEAAALVIDNKQFETTSPSPTVKISPKDANFVLSLSNATRFDIYCGPQLSNRSVEHRQHSSFTEHPAIARGDKDPKEAIHDMSNTELSSFPANGMNWLKSTTTPSNASTHCFWINNALQ